MSPFNFPLNPGRALKIAPALAVGCPFVMKPASRTPLGALIIGEVLAETRTSRRRLLHSAGPTARALDLHTWPDERLKLLSTSPARPQVGWDLKACALARKRWCWNWAATPR